METARSYPPTSFTPKASNVLLTGTLFSCALSKLPPGGTVAISALCEAFCTIWAGWISTEIVKKHLSRKIKVSLAKCGLERFAFSIHIQLSCCWETWLCFEKLQEGTGLWILACSYFQLLMISDFSSQSTWRCEYRQSQNQFHFVPFHRNFWPLWKRIDPKGTEVEEKVYKSWGKDGVIPQLGLESSGEVDGQGEVILKPLVMRLAQEYFSYKEYSEGAVRLHTYTRRMFWWLSCVVSL